MRKTVKNVVCILLILTLSLSTGLLAYLHFFAPGDRDVSGEWTARLPMTDQAAARAFGWLRDIEAVSVSLEEVEAGMQDLDIEVSLVFEKTDRSGGNFRCSVLPESYEACRQAAYEAFAGVFLELLAERLRMAGYTGGTDRESLEALVAGAFGMSTVDYLMSHGPALLPSLEELQDGYEGSGTYKVEEGIVTRYFEEDGTIIQEGYIRKDSSLVLSGGTDDADSGSFRGHDPAVYTLKQPESQ